MGFRITTRRIPDATQAAVASGVTVAQSTITFSGARGTVIVLWAASVENTGAAAIDRMQFSFGGSAQILRGIPGQGWFDAGAARRLTIHMVAIFVDPAELSTSNIVTSFSGGGTVDIRANEGTIMAVSLPTEEGGGPIVSVE